VDADGAIHVLGVRAQGALANMELGGDLLVGEASPDEECGHVALAWRERGRRARCAAIGAVQDLSLREGSPLAAHD
jgi:hypothetical protein